MGTEETRQSARIGNIGCSRRDLLKGVGTLAAALGLSPVLSACGVESSSVSATASPGATQKKGGVLKVGVAGGSAKDTLDAVNPVQQADTARVTALYEPLLIHDPDNLVIPALAEEMIPTQRGQVWTIRLKQGLEFHNGKTITADDVVFTFNRIISPDVPSVGANTLKDLKPSGIKKIDERTVELTLAKPNSVLDDQLASYYMGIIPVGYDPKNPVGSGPFVYKSFKPGDQSVFTAFENYYGTGPYVEELRIIDFVDDTARANALLGGSVDCISQVPGPQMKTLSAQTGLKVLRSETGAWLPFTMNVESKPFTDERVRQAFRLIVDRPQMVQLALGGLGRIGNDLFAPLDPHYNTSLPQRVQDIEQAKSLLKSAGYADLTVELTTSDVAAGVVAAAQVLQQQAKKAGVTVNLTKVDAAIFYGDKYLNWPFAQDYWYTRNYLPQVVRCEQPGASGNETKFNPPELLSVIDEAFRTVDSDKRKELIWAAQEIEYDRGGYIIFGFNDQIDAYSTKLTGLVPDKSGIPLSSFHFNQFSFV